MLTREEVLSIEDYCSENKITHKARLEELGIHFWDFYKAKKKYREEDSSAEKPGQFIQLSSGRCVPVAFPLIGKGTIAYKLFCLYGSYINVFSENIIFA